MANSTTLNLRQLQGSIRDALSLMEAAGLETLSLEPNQQASPLRALIEDAPSLLEKCRHVCNSEDLFAPPKIRVISHFACTGGSLISKCLSALPNTYVLSEVHPNTGLNKQEKPRFAPSDTSLLAKYSGIPDHDLLADSIFLKSIIETYEHLSLRGGNLVLREHSHSDYCLETPYGNVSRVKSCLHKLFQIASIVTVRDPVDSYLSVANNGWLHFFPQTFDEYCSRYLLFLDANSEAKLFKYENFIADPELSMEKMCDFLDLEFSDCFSEFFDIFRITGDSGRSGEYISNRTRPNISSELEEQIAHSPNYMKLKLKLGY
jgi:hypothetical protein